MKFDEKTKKLSIMLLAVVVIYSVLVFVIAGFSGHSGGFWSSYFMPIATIITFFLTFGVFKTDVFELNDWIFGFPLVTDGYVISAAQLVLSIGFMLLDKIISWKIAFVVQFVILIFYWAILVGCRVYVKQNDVVRETAIKDTSFSDKSLTQCKFISEMSQYDDIKTSYAQLYEQLRLSDPVSNKETALSEALILEKLSDASTWIIDEQKYADDLRENCRKLFALLEKRNMECRIGK